MPGGDSLLPDGGPVVVLGLGNPGAGYADNRHNAGFMVLDELAARHGMRITKSGMRCLWCKGVVMGRQVILAQPQTYMNLSGDAAAAVLSYFRLPPAGLVVVHDDLDLDFGRLKVARQGGSGGHKGIRSIIGTLGTETFLRLRFGVGRPRYGEPIEKYVLSGFYSDQLENVKVMVQVAADCLEVLLTQGVGAAMQGFHRPILNEED